MPIGPNSFYAPSIDYAAGLGAGTAFGQPVGQAIADIPDAHYKMQQMQFQQQENQRTLALQNAFPKGLPRVNNDPNGPIDVQGATNTIVRIGGAPALEQLLPVILRQQSLERLSKHQINDDPNAWSSSAAPPAAPQKQADPYAGLHNQATDWRDPASETPRSPPGETLSASGPNAIVPPVPYAKAPFSAGAPPSQPSGPTGLGTRTDPKQVRNTRDYQALKDGEYFVSPRNPTTPLRKGDNNQVVNGRFVPPAQQPAQATAGANDAGAGGATSGAPAPTTGTAEETPTYQPYKETPGANAMVDPRFRGGPAAYATALEAQANEYSNRARETDLAVAAGNTGLNSEADRNKAADLRKTAQSIREQLAKERTLDPAERAEATGLSHFQEAGKRAEAMYSKVQDASLAAQDMLDNAHEAKAFLNGSPMTSGFGAGAQMTGEGLASWAGRDPQKLAAMQSFEKIRSQAILNQVANLRVALGEATGSNAGARMFQTEMEQIVKAAQGVGTTMMANRILTEMQQRFAMRVSKIADEADAYAGAHGGHLDNGWYRHVRQWARDNPLFSPQEMANPTRYLGAPEVPQDKEKSQEATARWLNSRSIADDEVVRLGDGTYAKKHDLINIPLSPKSAAAQARQ